MSIELKEKDKSDLETQLVDHKNKTKEDEETRKALDSPQRKHSVNVESFSTSLKNMIKVSQLIQQVKYLIMS
jgi:hypothetical protein